MKITDIRAQWESAAPGWARWEAFIATWVEPATMEMLSMAGVDTGMRILDIACGAGSQTLRAARRVGPQGHVLATDIAETMLWHVQENARTAGLSNITTLAGAAEELNLAPGGFDAVICQMAMMHFPSPAKALTVIRHALRPGGKVAILVFTTPDTNPFMVQPMQILLRHAGKTPPKPGLPGIFALGAPGTIENLFANNGFVNIVQHTLTLPFRIPTSKEALMMIQEAFGAYRAVLSDCSETVRKAAWFEVAQNLKTFETPTGFVAPAEVLVAAGVKPA